MCSTVAVRGRSRASGWLRLARRVFLGGLVRSGVLLPAAALAVRGHGLRLDHDENLNHP
jgi:hypothetical protein